ncbi:MAG: PolC-type DNA polymerase III, partial [Ruminococcus sp.]|nr:PolC-type DNA polymerase III [Ruminococcus sp.]
MKTLGSIFGSVVGNTQIPEPINNGVVTRVNIINEVRLITLWVHFNSLIAHDDLIHTEKLYAKSLDSSVVIKPHFGKELFSTSNFPELYNAVRREVPSINGTLNNADVTYEDNTLLITLYNGGKAILDAKGFDAILTRIISEQFDLSLRIRYTGVLEMTEDNAAYQRQMQNAQKQVQRQQYEAMASSEAADAAVSDAVR